MLHVHLQVIRKHFVNMHLRCFPQLGTTYWCIQITMGGDGDVCVCDPHCFQLKKPPQNQKSPPNTQWS